MHIPVYKPLLGEEERELVMSALSRGEISGSSGEFVGKFEEGFSRYSDCLQGISVSNGTAALHLALVAVGIGDGDEVLTSSFTNMATFFAILYQRGKPIPIDIEPDTLNMNPGLIEEKITHKTKAILVAHIYGHPVDMDPVLKLAKAHGLHVIEDCAEAHGALYKGRKVGSLGDVGCFSFYANKIITTGEGGMLTTNDERIAEKARSLRSLAFGKNNKFMHRDVGFNYRMTNIQAAIGCAQMGKIEKIIDRKREIARHYGKLLENLRGLQLPVEKAYARNVYWMYHVIVDGEKFGSSRESVMERLNDSGIETRESFIPYNMQEIFIDRGWVRGNECPIASYVGKNGFYLPSSPLLGNEDVEHIANKIKTIQREAQIATEQ